MSIQRVRYSSISFLSRLIDLVPFHVNIMYASDKRDGRLSAVSFVIEILEYRRKY